MLEISHGNETIKLSRAEFDAWRAEFAELWIDVGTGDGKWAYRTARAQPARAVIGLDAARENLSALASRARRKPAKGGAPNLLFVIANAADPPPALQGIADAVQVNFPWGSLLEGMVRGDLDLLRAVASLGRFGAAFTAHINLSVYENPTQSEGLPDLDTDHVARIMRPAWDAAGLRVQEVAFIGPEEVQAVRSTWAGRLGHGSNPQTLRLSGIIG